jgi:hypothetical protein
MVQSQPRQIVCETLSQKNPSQKRAGGVAQGVGPEFKPQYCKKKKNPKTKTKKTLERNSFSRRKQEENPFWFHHLNMTGLSIFEQSHPAFVSVFCCVFHQHCDNQM